MAEERDTKECVEDRYYYDESTGKTITLRNECGWDQFSAIASLVYLLLMLAFFAWQLFDVWLSRYTLVRLLAGDAVGQLDGSGAFQLAMYCFIGGALGGVANGIRSFIRWHCELRAFGGRYWGKYVALPWLGATLALFVYVLIRSGIAVFAGIGQDSPGTAQGFSMFGIGALAGYGSRDVFRWLDVQVERLFKVSPAADVKVPVLKGMTVEEAAQALEAAGLVLGAQTEEVQEDPELVGRIVKQDPAANASLAPGSSVDVTVGSAGAG